MNHLIYIITKSTLQGNRELVYSLMSYQEEADDALLEDTQVHIYTNKPLVLPEERIFEKVHTHLIIPEEYEYMTARMNKWDIAFTLHVIRKHLQEGANILFLNSSTFFTESPDTLFSSIQSGDYYFQLKPNALDQDQIKAYVDIYSDISFTGFGKSHLEIVDTLYNQLEQVCWQTTESLSTPHALKEIISESSISAPGKTFVDYWIYRPLMVVIASWFDSVFKRDQELLKKLFNTSNLNLQQKPDVLTKLAEVLVKHFSTQKLNSFFPETSPMGEFLKRARGNETVNETENESPSVPEAVSSHAENLPLISCLCLTENRPHLLKKAIECFKSQTYPRKELVIVYPEKDLKTSLFLQQVKCENIVAVKIPDSLSLTLGERRNLSIQSATGEYFCQWDDDDWYHNDRLKWQYESLRHTNKKASVLMNKIVFNSETGLSYFSFGRPWENTIMCHRTTVLESGLAYPAQNKSEDTKFVKQLMNNRLVTPVDCPPAYIYIYHGGNTWGAEHFEFLTNLSQPLSRFANEVIHGIVQGELSNEQGSLRLSSETIANEIDYFFASKEAVKINNKIAQYQNEPTHK